MALDVAGGFLFLSTPSVRRATLAGVLVNQVAVISIHALHEEGDIPVKRREIRRSVFLSTPSARRATFGVHPVASLVGISIHALREEGDMWICQCPTRTMPFLSTPSVRRATAHGRRAGQRLLHFYPRPP